MTQETIKLDGLTMDVEFDYQPAERQTLEHPGCAEEYDLCTVVVAGVDIVSLISDETEERIIKELIKKAEKANDDYYAERWAA
jgi:hypothetical protein